MKEKDYDCPNCGDEMVVVGWSPEMKNIECNTCGHEMAAINSKEEQSLLEFLNNERYGQTPTPSHP